MTVLNPLQYVAVPYAELQALLEMARNVSKNSPWGQTDTQAWNPDIKTLPEIGGDCPTIAGIIGESNTVLVSMPDLEALKAMMPYIGANGNWYINGIDTGISATPDTSAVLRPQIVVEQPTITATANVDEVFITGGKVTVFSGTTQVKTVDVLDATLLVLNKPMIVVNAEGVVSAVDTTSPIVDAVPLFYVSHVASGTVNLDNVTPAILASELCYYAQALKQLDVSNLNNLNTLLSNILTVVADAQIAAVNAVIEAKDSILQQIGDSLAAVEAEVDALLLAANTKLSGVPRVLSFCSFNEAGYEGGDLIAYFKADHPFKFPENFAESLAGFELKNPYITNPETALIGIWVNSIRIGSIQINTDNSVVFIMYQQGFNIGIGDTIKFTVDVMSFITSITVSIKHYLGA